MPEPAEKAQETPSIQTGPAHAQGIGDTLIDTMPKVNPNAFDGAQPQAKPGKSKKPKEDDPYKRDENGKILKNLDGSPKKKAGRKPKQSKVHTPPDPIEEAAKQEAAIVQQIAGESAANLTFTLGMMISDEYAPIVDEATGQNEPLVMTKAYADYFASKGWNDIPPGAALLLTLGNYYGSRLARPKTQKRIGSVWSKMKVWAFSKWTDRQEKKKAKQAAPEKPTSNSTDKSPGAPAHPDMIQ